MKIDLTVNGRAREVDIEPAETLLSTLRDRMRLTGTKEGCNEGECGACTVLVDDLPVDACIYATAAACGRSVETVEGLSHDRVGAALQEAFAAAGGVQCGFCTPGFVATLVSVLRADPAPSEADVQLAVAGNICRCTGYSQILDAVAAAAASLGGVR